VSFFAELKRRNVFRASAAYLALGWVVTQVTSTVAPALHLPDWIVPVVVWIGVIGFPFVLVFSWAFELTPEGLKRESDIGQDSAVKHSAARRLDHLAIGLFAIAIVLFGVDRFLLRGSAPATTPVVAKAKEGGADPGVSAPGKPASEVSDKSIAVLPFENLSRDPDNAYFAEGIQDEILTRLAKIADLKVISRTSTAKYKSAPDNLREIASRLGVAHILEGSVQKANDQVRVNVQLINATSDAHLWAEIYDRKLTDIFAVESDVAKSIADALQAKLSGSEQLALSARPTENSDAYQLYLKGRFFWNKRTGADLRKSIDYFNEAIGKDPKYAQAYAGLAQAWLLLPGYSAGTPNESFPPAEAAAKKALTLDDTSADAHAALGMVKMLYDFDVDGSIAEFERAIRLDPNDATAHHWLANHPLAAAGRTERAIVEMKRAVELDPLSLIINTNLGQAYIYARRYDDAIAQMRKTIEMDGSFYIAHNMLAIALTLKRQIPEAIVEYKKAIALNDDSYPKGLLGYLYGTAGRQDEARRILESLLQAKEHRDFQAYNLAIVYLGLGDHDQALAWFEQGYRDRDGFAVGTIRVDPLLEPLYGDPRFEALAEKIVRAKDFTPVAAPAK